MPDTDSTQPRDGPSPLYLFLPFYTPKDAPRAAELRECLQRNLDGGWFAGIYLLQDDDTPPLSDDPRLHVTRLHARPTYLDWVRESRRLCTDGLSVLANSDIHFSDDIALLRDLFAAHPRAFVALSRYDRIEGRLQPHENPHWSQDSWAFDPGLPLPDGVESQLNVPMGVPRCDNKIAYVFSLAGHTIINPMAQITSVHVHETGLRYYDKTGDARVTGGVAMVHPGPDLTTPARLELAIWSRNTSQYDSVKISPALERWSRARRERAEHDRGVIGHDADWQYPAITEQYAFHQMQALANPRHRAPGVAYLGFPWATLIDLRTHARDQADRIAALENELALLTKRCGDFDQVVTVCQHIRVREHAELFARVGVTDLYWSHAKIGHDTMPEAPNVTLRPFPLYPVQRPDAPPSTDRPHLFSFVGAGAHKGNLSQARSWIIEQLSDTPGGVVINRDGWHYQKIVYSRQVLRQASSDAGLMDTNAADQFRQIMAQSVFALCPSGTGPNSIRLWEAIAAGTIPVVLADTYAPPDAGGLWDIATLRCPETPDAISALPRRLARLADNAGEMRLKRLALDLLKARYGPDRFVHDILERYWPIPA